MPVQSPVLNSGELAELVPAEAPEAVAHPHGNVVAQVQLTADEVANGCVRTVRVGEAREEVTVPVGTRDGEVLWFRGRGIPGPGGKRGDLSVRVRTEPVPQRGADLGVRLEVTDDQALYGAYVPLEFQGRALQVNVPARATAGQVIRIVGEGEEGEYCGPKGDLLVVVELRPTPVRSELDEREVATLAHVAMGVEPAPSSPWRSGGASRWMTATVVVGLVVAASVLAPGWFKQSDSTLPADSPISAFAPAPVTTPEPLPKASEAPFVGSEPQGALEKATVPVAKPRPAGERKPGAQPAVGRPARRVGRAVPVRDVPVRDVRAPSRRHAASAARRFCGGCGRPMRRVGIQFCARCGASR